MLLLLSRIFPLGRIFLCLRRMGKALLSDFVCRLIEFRQAAEYLPQPVCRAAAAIKIPINSVDLSAAPVDQAEEARQDALLVDNGPIFCQLSHEPCVSGQSGLLAPFHKKLVLSDSPVKKMISSPVNSTDSFFL